MDLFLQLGLDPTLVLVVLAGAVVTTVLMYYRFVINIFDQLIFFMVATIACDALVFGMPWTPAVKIEYSFFAVAFWIGFAMRGKVQRYGAAIQLSPKSLAQLEITVLLLFLALVAGNMLVGLTAGFPMFSDQPDQAKVTMYQGGLGVVRRLNLLPFTFFVSACVLLIIVNFRPRRHIAMLLIGSMLIAMTGGKSALLPPVVVIGLTVSHRGLMGTRKRLAAALSRYAFAGLVLAGVLAVLILVIDSAGGGLGGGLQLLGKRILFSGDVILYYFPTRGANPALAGLGWFNYLDYLFKGWLATIRVIPDYPPALGSVIMGIDKVGFGPNPLYFVRADIFFGPIAGCVYCALIGYGVSWLRQLFFNRKPVSVASAAIRLTLAAAAFGLAIDSAGLVGGVLDLLILVGPLWGVARLILYSEEVRRRGLVEARPHPAG